MGDLVKVVYDGEINTTFITVNGVPFNTDRIDGREIEEWVFPFMIRNTSWNGFYSEMVQALKGSRSFDLIFYGSDHAYRELSNALRGFPVRIAADNEVRIVYDDSSRRTDIKINGKRLDTADIQGRDINEWIRPFSARGIRWNGLFTELSDIIGSEIFTVKFIGSSKSMTELIIERPETVNLIFENIESKNTELSSSDDGGFDYTFNDIVFEEHRLKDLGDPVVLGEGEHNFFPYDLSVDNISRSVHVDTEDFTAFIENAVDDIKDAVLPEGDYVLNKLSVAISSAVSGYNNWCSIAIAKATVDKEAMPDIDYADELIYGDIMKAGYWKTSSIPCSKDRAFIHKLDTMRKMYTKVKGIHAVNLLKYHRDTMRAFIDAYESSNKYSELRITERYRFYYDVCRQAVFKVGAHLKEIYNDRANMSKYFMTYIKNTSPGIDVPGGRHIDMNDLCFEINKYLEQQLLNEVVYMNQDSLLDKVGYWLPFVEIAANKSMDKKANNICRASVSYISEINKGIYYFIVGKLFTAMAVREVSQTGNIYN